LQRSTAKSSFAHKKERSLKEHIEEVAEKIGSMEVLGTGCRVE
jgi:hypothetical protein